MRLLIWSFFAITMFSCGTEKSPATEELEYVQTKESLESIEKKQPTRFLRASLKKKKNLIGQTVLRGSVKSTATVASYKDIEIKLRFYSKTGAVLEENIDKVYETIGPGEEKNFKLKYFAPKDTDSASVTVIKATSLQ